MKNILPFEGKGNWYKGNLHCHSTMSDGTLSPEKLVEIYKGEGYSFLAFSDHRVFTNCKEFNTDDFLIMPAVENDVLVNNAKCFHINGIQGSKAHVLNAKNEPLQHRDRFERPLWEGLVTVQKMTDDLNHTGNLVMFNHPVWSANELDDLLGLKGYFALEIFNYGCEVENQTGCSTIYWDSLLKRGIHVWGIATDDNHNRQVCKDTPLGIDSFGGWINIKAESLTHDHIAEALQSGRFYSSSGPQIHDYGIKDGTVFIECSDVETICFITSGPRVGYRSDYIGGTLNHATFKSSDVEGYVRIECTDKYGKTAWTNPIF